MPLPMVRLKRSEVHACTRDKPRSSGSKSLSNMKARRPGILMAMSRSTPSTPDDVSCSSLRTIEDTSAKKRDTLQLIATRSLELSR